MKMIDYYMSLPYRLEIIPDPDEGGMQRAIRNFRGVLRSGALWKLLWKMQKTQKRNGSRRLWEAEPIQVMKRSMHGAVSEFNDRG